MGTLRGFNRGLRGRQCAAQIVFYVRRGFYYLKEGARSQVTMVKQRTYGKVVGYLSALPVLVIGWRGVSAQLPPKQANVAISPSCINLPFGATVIRCSVLDASLLRQDAAPTPIPQRPASAATTALYGLGRWMRPPYKMWHVKSVALSNAGEVVTILDSLSCFSVTSDRMSGKRWLAGRLANPFFSSCNSLESWQKAACCLWAELSPCGSTKR